VAINGLSWWLRIDCPNKAVHNTVLVTDGRGSHQFFGRHRLAYNQDLQVSHRRSWGMVDWLILKEAPHLWAKGVAAYTHSVELGKSCEHITWTLTIQCRSCGCMHDSRFVLVYLKPVEGIRECANILFFNHTDSLKHKVVSGIWVYYSE